MFDLLLLIFYFEVEDDDVVVFVYNTEKRFVFSDFYPYIILYSISNVNKCLSFHPFVLLNMHMQCINNYRVELRMTCS